MDPSDEALCALLGGFVVDAYLRWPGHVVPAVPLCAFRLELSR